MSTPLHLDSSPLYADPSGVSITTGGTAALNQGWTALRFSPRIFKPCNRTRRQSKGDEI